AQSEPGPDRRRPPAHGRPQRLQYRLPPGRAADRVEPGRDRPPEPERDRPAPAAGAALPEPDQALVRTAREGHRREVQDQARARVPDAGAPAVDPDLHHRVQFHQPVDQGWFKPQVERPLDQALVVAQTYYHNLERTALRHAQHIGRVIDREGLLRADRRGALAAYLVEQQEQLGISAITVFNTQGREFVHVKDPVLGDVPDGDMDESKIKLWVVGHMVLTVRELQSGDLIEAFMPIWSSHG